MAESSAKFNLIIGAVDNFSAPFKAFGSAMDSGAGKLKKLGREFSSFKKSLDKSLGFSQTKAAINGLGLGLANVGGEAKKLFGALSKLGAIAGLTGGGLAGGIYKLSQGFAEAGTEAADMAQLLGLTTRQWQSMAYAAKMSGIETSVLQSSYEKLNQSLIAAASGGKTQAAAFKALGVSTKSLNEPGKLKATETLMTELAEAFSKLPNDAIRAGLATKIFGQAGVKMLPMLNKGAAGLEELRLTAADKGLVFSNEDIAAGQAFNETLTDTNSSFKGLGYSIGSAFLPVVTDVVKIFGDLVDANSDLIKTKANEWAASLKKSLPAISDGLIAFVNAIPGAIKKIGKIVTALGGWKNIGKRVALILAGPLLKSILGLAGPILTLGKAIMTTPLGLLLGLGAGFAALMAHAGVLNPFLDGISEGFKGLSGALNEAFVELLRSVAGLFGDISDSLVGVNGEIDPEAWRKLGKAIGEFAGGALVTLVHGLTKAVGLIKALGEGIAKISLGGGNIDLRENVIEQRNLLIKQKLAEINSGPLTAERKDYYAGREKELNTQERASKGFFERGSMVDPDIAKTGAPKQNYYRRPIYGRFVAPIPKRDANGPKALSGDLKDAVQTIETKHTDIQRAEVNIRVKAEGAASTSVTSSGLPPNAKISADGSLIGLSNSGG